jgi:quinone-modifying oxidoreductase, subunit QmoC
MADVVSVLDPNSSVAKREDFVLLREVSLRTPGESHVDMCIQCGTCGGSCPSGSAMDHTPRAIFAMLRAGMRDEVMKSNTPWMCVSCYFCTVRCPQNIHITDVMYTLKNMSLDEKKPIVPVVSAAPTAWGLRNSSQEPKKYNPTAADFSKTFIWMVENFGRSFEIGLAGVHNVRHFITRLPNMTPMAIGMLTKKGMSPLPPKRIKGMDQLGKILQRAKELESA